MTNCVIQHNSTFRVYYMKKRSEGQPFKKTVFATAHKLIRVIFAMLTQRTMFKEVCAYMTEYHTTASSSRQEVSSETKHSSAQRGVHNLLKTRISDISTRI
ncbi:MAG TPA: hypothetical protein VLD55_02825 [Candidatus Sulfobium mesophilum]|jgi:hypothetical protein|nr:hypothetical protein [Candidatus Sulfobium mesophilum]